MADKLDLDANPYEALGLGEGSAELSMADIKKARRATADEARHFASLARG